VDEAVIPQNRFIRCIACGVDIMFAPLVLGSAVLARIISAVFPRPESPRIFMGTMHTNNWVYVARAMREKGLNVRLIVWRPPLHEIETIPYDVILAQRFKLIFKTKLGQYFFQFCFFSHCLFRYDIFIMPFLGRLLDNAVLLRWLEFPLLKFAKKKLILNSYGADVMTPRKTLGDTYKYSAVIGYRLDPYYAQIDEDEIERNRQYGEDWADLIISAIDHLDYLKRVDIILHMRCVSPEEFQPIYDTGNKTVKIIHAPNHRLLKGTAQLIRAVEELRQKGLDIELRVLEKTPHTQVMEAVQAADIVADQFILGTYARFAIEGMALGKPVMCYLRDDLFEKNPIWRDCPIVNTNPDNLVDNLEMLIRDKNLRAERGRQGRLYVERYHSTEYIGQRMQEIIAEIWNKDA